MSWLAKLFPGRFRQRTTISVGQKDWDRFRAFINEKIFNPGDRVTLEATSGRYSVTFLVVKDPESTAAEKPSVL